MHAPINKISAAQTIKPIFICFLFIVRRFKTAAGIITRRRQKKRLKRFICRFRPFCRRRHHL